jgi:pSer/pThr/pTyr-binding forkhead associated (FHA) protein
MAEEDTLNSEADVWADISLRPGVHYLIAMSGPYLGEKYAVDQPHLVIGRDNTSEISVPDRTASRRHAEITKSHGRIVIRDISSRNGLFINNLRVDEWVLRNGDLIRIGGSLLQFVEAESRRSFYVGKYHPKVTMQRKHPRFSLIAVGDGYLTEEKIPVEILSIKDLSRAGIGIFSKTKVENGAEIRVAVYFKNKEKQIVAESVVGITVSCNEWRGESYMISVRFHEPISENTSPGLHVRLTELEKIF